MNILTPMEVIINSINKLFKTIHASDWDELHKIPQSGGDRVYFRILQGNQSWIATYDTNIKESKTFTYFAEHFYAKGLTSGTISSIRA